ncbi:MAG: DUF2855 family protein [Pseudohongiellaceae bacterium]
MSNLDFIVKRDDLSTTTLVEAKPITPNEGQAVLSVERFALTANNITYGVAGDLIGYWQFFPCVAEGQGRIPVWGIATVTAENASELAVGDRYYGYFPMSNELLVTPTKVSSRGFTDGVEHRAELPIVYNQYTKVSSDNGFEPGMDNHKMLYAPLFTTSFVLDDFFADNDDFGAKTVVLGSASSKTAFGMAFMLKRSGRVKVIGLTSEKNASFVAGLGLYDEVTTYGKVTELDAEVATAYVDMSGNPEVLSSIHHHFTKNLVHSCAVGITHWESRQEQAMDALPGAKPTMFFAPSQIVKRNKEWGAAQYQARLAEATSAFLEQVDNWVKIKEHSFKTVDEIYQEVLIGAPANEAVIVVMGEANKGG